MKAPPHIAVQLIHMAGPLKGEIQDFDGRAPIVVGRHPSCGVCFPAELTIVSRKHAEIVREGNQFRLTNHGANGTFVNGKQMSEAVLKDGDVLMFSDGGPKVSFLAEIGEDDGTQPVEPVFPEQPEPVAAPAPPPDPVLPPSEAPKDAPPSTSSFHAAPAPQPPPPVRAEPPPRPASPPVPPPAPADAGFEAKPVKMPLSIQFGPVLRSYRELPVTLGRHPGCQFVVDHPAVSDRHALIFFADGKYRVEDLTGNRLVTVNRHPIDRQAPLSDGDLLELTPKGPGFHYVAEGRLAEAEEALPEPPPQHAAPSGTPPEPEKKGGSIFKKFFGG